MENELKVCAGLKHKQIGSFEFLDIQLFDRGMKQKTLRQYTLLCLMHQHIKRVDQIPACRIISSS